jgi:hypothetical protein
VLAFSGPPALRPPPLPAVPERVTALSRAKAAPSFGAAHRPGAAVIDGNQVRYRSAPRA